VDVADQPLEVLSALRVSPHGAARSHPGRLGVEDRYGLQRTVVPAWGLDAVTAAEDRILRSSRATPGTAFSARAASAVATVDVLNIAAPQRFHQLAGTGPGSQMTSGWTRLVIGSLARRGQRLSRIDRARERLLRYFKLHRRIHFDVRTFARLRLDSQAPAQQIEPLPNANEPEATRVVLDAG